MKTIQELKDGTAFYIIGTNGKPNATLWTLIRKGEDSHTGKYLCSSQKKGYSKYWDKAKIVQPV